MTARRQRRLRRGFNRACRDLAMYSMTALPPKRLHGWKLRADVALTRRAWLQFMPALPWDRGTR